MELWCKVLLLASIAVVYIVQAVVAGYIAMKRGHFFLFWMGVALLLIFPVGFIATLIYTKDKMF